MLFLPGYDDDGRTVASAIETVVDVSAPAITGWSTTRCRKSVVMTR